MLRRILLAALAAVMLPMAAAADIGQPSSFSVTIDRSPGAVDVDLLVTTQSPVNPLPSDAMGMMFFIVRGGDYGPTFSTATAFTVLRGTPTTTTQFTASFSLAVPNPQMPFKYAAVVGPYGVGNPPGLDSVLSFLVYSHQPDLEVLSPPPTPVPGAPPSPPVWLWAKGQQTQGVNIPALSLAGLLGLGALMALAGALLLRRS